MRTLIVALSVFTLACASEPTELTALQVEHQVHAAQATTQPADAEPEAEEATADAKATCPYHQQHADTHQADHEHAAHGDCPHKKAAATHSTCPHLQQQDEQAEAADADTTQADTEAAHADCCKGKKGTCKHHDGEQDEQAADAPCPHAAAATPDV